MYSIWLTLNAKLATELSDHIDKLAQLTGGPAFEPHLTLCGDLKYERNEVLKLASTMAEAFSGARAKFTEVDFGSSYFQSVFLTMELPESLAGFRLSILSRFGIEPQYPPHISLAYGVKDPEPLLPQLEQINSEFAGQSVTFDNLTVMASSEDRPVEQWRCLNRFHIAA